MKPNPELQSLLEDILAPDGDPGTGTRQLEPMLGLVRRRRRTLRLRRIGAAALGAALLAWCGGLRFHPESTGKSATAGSVSSVAAPRLVATRALPPGQIVQTKVWASVVTTSSLTHSVETVETSRKPRLWSFVDDDALLALVQGRGAMLVRKSPERTELIFPEGSEGAGAR